MLRVSSLFFVAMNIAILSASPRENSASLRVAKAVNLQLKAVDKEDHNISLIDFRENDIPMVGRGELNPHALTPFQRRWIDTLQSAQLVICVVPEYNWIMPGEWIDAWHQTGRTTFAHLFDGKVFAVIGVSSGRGGRRPALETQQLLNKLISFLGQSSVVAPAIFESHETEQNVDEQGRLFGTDVYRTGLERFLKLALNTAKRWCRQQGP
jgi:chromate reductase